MISTSGYPSRAEADRLLVWASEQNPGQWVDHCHVVARAVETIAGQCGMDDEKAYVLGLLHDVGRYEGVRDLHHSVAGYHLLHREEYDIAARICLTHSFPYQDFGAYSGKFDCTESEIVFVKQKLTDIQYDDYDLLIQLGDALGSSHGIVLIDVRVLDVIRRHGFTDLTLKKLDATFAVKAHFDRLCQMNVYDLFREEICSNSIR